MARLGLPDATAQIPALGRFLHGLVRLVRRLAIAGAAGVAAIALLLRRADGFGPLDGAVTILLLAPTAILLLFGQGILELASLPDRLRRLPLEGQQRLEQLARLAGEARTARARNAPLLLWRLRGAVGSLREVAGIALPLRVLTPGFLALAALAALVSAALAGAGLIALLVVALG